MVLFFLYLGMVIQIVIGEQYVKLTCHWIYFFQFFAHQYQTVLRDIQSLVLFVNEEQRLRREYDL